MKASELRNKTTEELAADLVALQKEQFNLRMKKGARSEEAPKTHNFKLVRRQIAQIKTVLNELKKKEKAHE